MGDSGTPSLGRPRLHLRRTDSTNERARALAILGAPHGTLVSTAEQTAGRGRQGRDWIAPAGRALLCSLVIRDPPPLLSLIAGVAVCDAVGDHAWVKWPNDVVARPRNDMAGVDRANGTTAVDQANDALADRRSLEKLAGILVEGRPQQGWAVVGIGLNVAVEIARLPLELHGRAASLELPPSQIEPLLERLLESLERRSSGPLEETLEAWRERDALYGRKISWGGDGPGAQIEHGRAAGIDDTGRLIVSLAGGDSATLDAGEVHLRPAD